MDLGDEALTRNEFYGPFGLREREGEYSRVE